MLFYACAKMIEMLEIFSRKNNLLSTKDCRLVIMDTRNPVITGLGHYELSLVYV